MELVYLSLLVVQLFMAVFLWLYRDQVKELEDSDVETGGVLQLDGADKDGKKERREGDKLSVGVKRGRNSVTSSRAPPSKTMQLNSGERVATLPGEKGEGVKEEDDDEEGEGEKKDKSLKQKQELVRKSSIHRPRTRSLSNSDNPVAGFSPTKTSPMTRSHSAVKKDVEFVSLPSTKKRKKGGGRWPKRDTPSPSPSQESSKAETPTKQKTDPLPMKSETPNKQLKSEPDASTDEGPGMQVEADETPPQPVQPPKRRRGRPPKHQRKDGTAVTPTSQAKGKGVGTSGAGSGGRGRGRGKSSSGDSTGERKGGGGSLKGEGDAPKEKPHSESSASSNKAVRDEEVESPTTKETEAPLPSAAEDGTEVAGGTTERKRKKKERSGSKGDGKGEEKMDKKTQEEVSEPVIKQEDIGMTEETAEGDKEDSASSGAQPGNSRPSVFVSVLSGPGKPVSGEDDPARGKEEGGSHESPQPHDANGEGSQKPSHVVQTSYSPTIFPASFPPHAPYPYPGPYPPPLMFPGTCTSNPMYPHYYAGYPPLPPPPPPPPPPTVSQPMPGAFIPSCPSEPLPPFSATQPLTSVGGVQVSVLDKQPSQVPTAHSPHSPHTLPISTQHQAPPPHTVGEGAPKAYNLSPNGACKYNNSASGVSQPSSLNHLIFVYIYTCM